MQRPIARICPWGAPRTSSSRGFGLHGPASLAPPAGLRAVPAGPRRGSDHEALGCPSHGGAPGPRTATWRARQGRDGVSRRPAQSPAAPCASCRTGPRLRCATGRPPPGGAAHRSRLRRWSITRQWRRRPVPPHPRGLVDGAYPRTSDVVSPTVPLPACPELRAHGGGGRRQIPQSSRRPGHRLTTRWLQSPQVLHGARCLCVAVRGGRKGGRKGGEREVSGPTLSRAPRTARGPKSCAQCTSGRDTAQQAALWAPAVSPGHASPPARPLPALWPRPAPTSPPAAGWDTKSGAVDPVAP